jgi:hypothetical protein
MPVLPSPKYERFAQARAKGMSASAAYVAAGYKKNDGNAARLNGNEKIQARIAELVAAVAQKAITSISFDAKELFLRLEQDIADAKESGDHKAAIAGRLGQLKAFGYMDSPTLTHEHVNGTRIGSPDPADAKTIEDETPRNILAFGPAHRKMIEITGKKG